MSRLRALLLGVAEYAHERISPLPFVLDDLQDLRSALERHGYAVEIPHGDGRVGRTRLLEEVSGFLDSGKREDTLLVYLSGHGVHTSGEDYLVPSDAELQHRGVREAAVALSSWNSDIDNSAAGGVAFFVDACREGIDESMSISKSIWSHDKVRTAGHRQVAWIFPCAPGEVSRYVRADGQDVPKPFSLFARSTVNVLNHPVAPVTLKEFERSLRNAMGQLTERHRKQRQDIRVITNGRSDADQFVLFPAKEPGPRGWEQAAAAHPAWGRATDAPKGIDLHTKVLALVRDLANRRHAAGAACRPYPWTEGGGFALRMTERMSFILSPLLPGLTLTQAEAALLVTVPFLLDTCEAAAMEKAVSQARPGGSRPWWERHRRIASQPGTFARENLPALLRAMLPEGTFAREVLTPGRLHTLLRAVHAENGVFAPGGQLGLHPDVVIAGGRSSEQILRERLVGILATVAHRLAISGPSLPDLTPADHDAFGPVRPAHLYAALEKATWEPYGRSRTLTVECGHPAIERALRVHAGRLDELLAHLDARAADSDLAVLRDLPVRSLASGVTLVAPDGGPAHDGGPPYDSVPVPDALAYVMANSADMETRRTPPAIGQSGRTQAPRDPGSPADPADDGTAGPDAGLSPVPAPGPDADLSPVPVPGPVSTDDDIVRWLLEISEAVEAGAVRDFGDLVAALADAAQRADAGGAGTGSRRQRLVDLIGEHRLLRAGLHKGLGPDAMAYDRALLWLAFGLPLSYEAYCQLEDALGTGGSQEPPPAPVLSTILRNGPTDVRVAMIALSYWEESERRDWLTANGVDTAALVDHLANGWDHLAHEKLVVDSFLWLLRVMPEMPDSVHAADLRPALSRHGYLAERLAAQYPGDSKFQADALRALLQAAWSDAGFGRAAVGDALRYGRETRPPALVAAVLSLVPEDSELRGYANRLLFLARRGRT